MLKTDYYSELEVFDCEIIYNLEISFRFLDYALIAVLRYTYFNLKLFMEQLLDISFLTLQFDIKITSSWFYISCNE